jgi:hypothetical protein
MEEPNEPVVLRLPPSLIDNLDQARIDFKRRVSNDKRNSLSRSKLCELILSNAMKDYKDKGDTSHLYEILLFWNNEAF